MSNRPPNWPVRRPKSKGVPLGGQADRLHPNNDHDPNLLHFEPAHRQSVHGLAGSQGCLGLNYNNSGADRVSGQLLDVCLRNSSRNGHPSTTSQIHTSHLLADKFTAVLFSGLRGRHGTERPLDRPVFFSIPYCTLHNFQSETSGLARLLSGGQGKGGASGGYRAGGRD